MLDVKSVAVYPYLVRISDNVDAFIAAELKRRGYPGLTRSHLEILSLLHRFSILTLSEIADKIERSRPTVTILVQKLLAHSLCERKENSEDGRSAHISLSAGGKKTKRTIVAIYLALDRLTSSRVTSVEVDTLRHLLVKLYGGKNQESAGTKYPR